MARPEHAPGGAPAPPARGRTAVWRTAITSVQPNRILLRGYPLDEAMGRLSFAETIYLLFIGELPSPAIGKLMEALLVSTIDHGPMPPSTVAARSVATTGAPLRASVAAGVLAFGRYHGGDIESCMRFLERGVALVRQGHSYSQAAERIVAEQRERGDPIPGFGHRIHTHDPRSARLFQMALELELDGQYQAMSRAVERVLNAERGPDEPHIPINVDGAIAAVSGDLGLPPELGNALFIVARVPGLIAQAYEEQQREAPMRQIDAAAHVYDGPSERRLPETRV
jgi:citrate synthase